MGWILSGLAGMGIGLLSLVILIPIISLFKKHSERAKVKKMIKNGQFLQPLDKKDYDYQKWDKEINQEENEKELQGLDNKIFKRDQKDDN